MNHKTAVDLLTLYSYANKETPKRYLPALLNDVAMAGLVDEEGREVRFHWRPQDSEVWLRYDVRSQMSGFPWSMGKEQARKLWDDLIQAGFEWR